jgi:hypothetical protein
MLGGGRLELDSLFATASTSAQGLVQPPIRWTPATLFSEVKGPESEGDHFSISTEVKNAWSNTSTLPYVLIKHETLLLLPFIAIKVKVKIKIVTVPKQHTMKAYRWHEGKPPCTVQNL